jgi:diguanylate cyclase (GGDEF)-like protein
VTRATPSSFTLKLVVYFLLLSLLPAAAAFWGFSSVARESEARRVDARLQAGLRAATFAYEERVSAAQQSANALANDFSFQQALVKGDETVVRSALSEASDVRIQSKRLSVGPKPTYAVENVNEVVRHDGVVLGSVIASVAFDQKLLAHLHRRSGLESRERVVVVQDGRIVVAPTWLRGPLDADAGRTATISIANDRYRALVGPSANGKGPALAVLAPQADIDAASTRLQRRLFMGLLAAVVLIALVAYFEGRTIVRAVSRIAVAANAISRGKLDERVPVRGRDELAKLGSAFNQMADQLQVRLEELESERQRLRDALSRFGDALAATHDVEQLLRSIVETAVEATDAHGGMLLAADGHVVEVGVAGAGSDQLEIPLHAGKVGFGTLFLFGRNFDEEARITAVSLVGQSVMALENARLHRIVERQALADGLTGLANRRHSEDSLATELARADRFGGPLAIVLADIDDFKSVNDRHGHPVGDTVLCELARLLDSSVRDVDVAGRWGGEEFILVLPGTDADGAVRLAGRIRALLEDRTLVTPEGVPVRITASLGVAAYENGGSAEELVAAADAALYEAKRAGKNRVAQAPRLVSRP